jgi:hypothetical protein
MGHAFPPRATLYTPYALRTSEVILLRWGASCWVLLFTTAESIRAYRAAAGITDRCNMLLFPSEAVAEALRRAIGRPGNAVVGALLDPAYPSPASGKPVPIDRVLEWVDGWVAQAAP